jgi:hypothetical protein
MPISSPSLLSASPILNRVRYIPVPILQVGGLESACKNRVYFSAPTRDRTRDPCVIGKCSNRHWTNQGLISSGRKWCDTDNVCVCVWGGEGVVGVKLLHVMLLLLWDLQLATLHDEMPTTQTIHIRNRLRSVRTDKFVLAKGLVSLG